MHPKRHRCPFIFSVLEQGMVHGDNFMDHWVLKLWLPSTPAPRSLASLVATAVRIGTLWSPRQNRRVHPKKVLFDHWSALRGALGTVLLSPHLGLSLAVGLGACRLSVRLIATDFEGRSVATFGAFQAEGSKKRSTWW